MTSNFDCSIKLAKEIYNYRSPEEPGNLPKGIIVKNKKYILIPINHTAVCDSKKCQEQYNIDKKNPKKIEEYTKAPIYSNWGNDELCLICANLENIKFFIPSKSDIDYMIEILDSNNMSCLDSDEGDEGDEGDSSQSDEDIIIDFTQRNIDILNDKMDDLTKSFII